MEQRRLMLEQRTLVQRIREEFETLPQLRVAVDEATRFWAIDEIICESVLRQLAAVGFLAQGTDKRFEMYRQA